MNTPRVDHAIRAINPDAKFAVFDGFGSDSINTCTIELLLIETRHRNADSERPLRSLHVEILLCEDPRQGPLDRSRRVVPSPYMITMSLFEIIIISMEIATYRAHVGFFKQ